STSPASSARSIPAVNNPFRPARRSTTLAVSPLVAIILVSISASGRAAQIAFSTNRACVRASSLPRVPSTILKISALIAPLQFRRAQRTIAHEGMLRRLRGPIQPARNRIDEVSYVFGDDRLRSSNLLATQRERLLRDQIGRASCREKWRSRGSQCL